MEIGKMKYLGWYTLMDDFTVAAEQEDRIAFSQLSLAYRILSASENIPRERRFSFSYLVIQCRLSFDESCSDEFRQNARKEARRAMGLLPIPDLLR